MSKSQEPQSPTIYSIVETVAVSSRTVLRRARNDSDGTIVLVESLKGGSVAQQRQGLERERDLLSQLAAPGLLRARELGEIEGQLVLFFDDFAGLPMSPPEGGMEVGWCLELALQTVRALAELHDHGMIHNELRPENLLVNREAGLLKLVNLQQVSSRMAGVAALEGSGSLAYIAPERTGRVNRRSDHRADYYALGVTLFQMLTGKLPFSASDALGWAHAHLSKQAPLVSDLRPEVPQVLAQFVAKLLAKNPDDRYQGSHGLLADLVTLSEAWTQAGAIPAFELGVRDISREFELGRDVVGRDAELAASAAIVEEVRAGATRLLLVSGAAGVGKSALFGELSKRLRDRSRHWLSGAFDKQARNIPFSGLTQALRGLVSDVLSRSEADLGDTKQQLISALGTNARVMVDLLPDLARILGPQPAVAQLNPLETQHRLHHVLLAFVSVFARVDEPVVLAFDDCQWVDASTAEALSTLLTSPDLKHVMVLAAYRDAEISATHPLAKLRQLVQRLAPERAESLELKPLDPPAIAHWVADTFRTSVSEVRELSELLHRKTDGNPFFVGELLSTLFRQGTLTLDVEHGRWLHDLERAEACQVSDNVGQSMAERLDRVSPAAARLLSAAACFGNRFELGALASIAELAYAACSELIWEAISERLLIPVEIDAERHSATGELEPQPEVYAFQHARVQQAASARLSDSERITLHGRIGRLLQRRAVGNATPTLIFDVLQHLNLARTLLTEPNERVELAELNLRATAQALRSAASNIAEAHAQVAAELMGERERSLAPELAFRVFLARAEAVFLVGDGAAAEAMCEGLFDLAQDVLARGKVHVLKTRILEYHGRLFDAVSQIRAGASELGVHLPESPEEIGRGIGEGIAKMQAHLSRVSVEELADLPEADSAETKLVLSLLEQVIPPAIQTYPPLFILAELIMFDLALTRGVSAASCKNFVDCGIIQAGMLNNHDVAYRLGQAAFKLLKRYAPTPIESGVSFVFAAFVSHWRVPFQEGFAAYDQAEKVGLQLGDLQHVAYALTHRTQRSFLTGKHLQECQREVAQASSYLARIGARGTLVGTLVAERTVSRLLAASSDAEAVAKADAEAEATVIASKNNQWAYSYGQAQVMTSFILGDFEEAHRFQAFTKPFSLSAASLFSVADYHLFEALLAVRAYREGPEAERDAHLQTIDQNLQKLKIWAQACPENFAHKQHLLNAERARALAEPLQVVLAAYQDAVSSAGDGFPQLRALALEREADLWLSIGNSRHARSCIEAAYRLYDGWGALAKTERLERQFPAWLGDSSSLGSSRAQDGASFAAGQRGGGLDAASILKSTQSISSEVQPQKLFSALMATLIENAGAQQGSLILQDDRDQEYYVEARADVEQRGLALGKREPFASAESVCAAIVRYVVRSREAVTLDDATALGAFQADPYIKQQRVRSVLCAPILRQGELLGVLYLENNLTSHAFNGDRLAILQVIASQAAISIYNAQLYQSLEVRVAARTEELAFKNRQIASMLDNMDQGVFTIDETLQVQPGYSRYLEQILGTTEILGKNCIDLLFGDAELRPDAVKAAASALYFSFGVEPWLAEANACHLITEMQKNGADLQPRFFEISWNLICNEAGVVERVLVAVRDVTLLRLLKQAANEKQREIDIVAQTLEVGIEVLNEFCDMCLQLLDENRNALLADGSTSPTAIAEAFRNLHTLKGNARLHGFTHLVDGLHAAEDSYAARRDDPDMPVDVALLLKHLDAVSGIALQYQDVCQRKLAPLSKARSSRAERTLQEIASLVRRSDFDGESTELLSCIRESLHRLEGASLEGLVAAVQPMLPSLAAELGKATPLLAVQHADLQLRPEWAPVIKDSLVQTLRNSLYHGLEAPADREKTGKPPAGQIEVRVVRGVGAFEVLIADDGLGLALGALRQRGFDDTATDEAIAEIIFQSGVSTAAEANHIAGRGVGLDIVRSRLRSLGGDAVVRFTGEQVGGRRPFAVVLVLPTSAVLPPGRDKRPPVQQKAEEGAFAVVGLRGSTPSDRPRGSTLTPELG